MGEVPKPAEPGVSLGHVLVDKYRVEAILGRGAMGVVARCMHLQLNETVAVKMLRAEALSDRDTVERFTREAQAAARLRSEHVARVTDVGTANGVPYMVMEYLDGQDLGQLLAQRRRFGVAQVVELVLQAAEALAEAHSLGIVHRDIKPSNLFITQRPDGSLTLKVLDFGISKAPTGLDLHLTHTQSVLGTPAYMSPEQMRSAHTVDARSDVWSLGLVMYELLEGRRPFSAESFSEMCVKVACDPAAPMTDTPPELQAVVLRCLEKAPEARYPNMAALARELVPFVSDPHQGGVLVQRMLRVLGRGPVDWHTGPRQSIDVETTDPVMLPSGAVVRTQRTRLWLGFTRRDLVLYGAGAIVAILVGWGLAQVVVHHRESAAAADTTTAAQAAPAAPTVTPIAVSPVPVPVPVPVPAAPAPEAAAAKPAVHHVVKHPPPPKRPTPACDVYLYPHGCPH